MCKSDMSLGKASLVSLFLLSKGSRDHPSLCTRVLALDAWVFCTSSLLLFGHFRGEDVMMGRKPGLHVHCLPLEGGQPGPQDEGGDALMAGWGNSLLTVGPGRVLTGGLCSEPWRVQHPCMISFTHEENIK